MFLHLLGLLVQGKESLDSIGFVQNRCWPSMGSDKNAIGDLNGSEQRTIYQRPWRIWKECVNYKQQGLSAICSAVNDVIFTLKLPETHFTKDCILNYLLCFEHAATLVYMPGLSTSSPWEPFAVACQSSLVFFKATILKILEQQL